MLHALNSEVEQLQCSWHFSFSFGCFPFKAKCSHKGICWWSSLFQRNTCIFLIYTLHNHIWIWCFHMALTKFFQTFLFTAASKKAESSALWNPHSPKTHRSHGWKEVAILFLPLPSIIIIIIIINNSTWWSGEEPHTFSSCGNYWWTIFS